MELKKTVTQAVVAANRRNAAKSTGPKTERGKKAASGNAMTHGILARNLRFKSEDERAAYLDLRRDLDRSIDAPDTVQRMMADILAASYLRYGRSLRLDTKFYSKETNRFTEVALDAISKDDFFGISHFGDEENAGWECQELSLIRKNENDSERKNGPIAVGRGNDHQVEFHAKFSDPAKLALRYQQAAANGFYRALREFEKLRKAKNKDDHEKH
jgi:hypothetical protein